MKIRRPVHIRHPVSIYNQCIDCDSASFLETRHKRECILFCSMCVCECIHIYMHIYYIYMSTYICIYLIYICLYTCIDCDSASFPELILFCAMCVSECIHTYTYIYIHMCVHIYMRIQIFTYTKRRLRQCLVSGKQSLFAEVYFGVHTSSYIHIYVYVCQYI